MRYLLGLALFVLSFDSYSWDGTVTGKINKIDVTAAENYGFRIILNGAPTLCGNNRSWAYLNDSDSNYQVYISVLLAAKMAQSTVTIYANQTGPEGYCKVGYISVR